MNSKKAVPGDKFLEELEGIREMILHGEPFRPNLVPGATKEQYQERRRNFHSGGDINHRFEGERYLNVPEKSVRREQLRKLIDEGGQTTVGGKTPSHPTLARWESNELGLSDEEITRLEKEEPSADKLIKRNAAKKVGVVETETPVEEPVEEEEVEETESDGEAEDESSDEDEG